MLCTVFVFDTLLNNFTISVLCWIRRPWVNGCEGDEYNALTETAFMRVFVKIVWVVSEIISTRFGRVDSVSFQLNSTLSLPRSAMFLDIVFWVLLYKPSLGGGTGFLNLSVHAMNGILSLVEFLIQRQSGSLV